MINYTELYKSPQRNVNVSALPCLCDWDRKARQQAVADVMMKEAHKWWSEVGRGREETPCSHPILNQHEIA